MRCDLPIAPIGNDKETVRIQAVGKNLHIGCYKCEVGKMVFFFSVNFRTDKQRFIEKDKVLRKKVYFYIHFF